MKFLISCFLLLTLSSLSAQNTYHRIVEINKNQRWLRSNAATSVTGGTSLLIYQHGGANISPAGGNTGQVTNINGAGLFDLNRVSRIGGDTLFLALPLAHNFNLPHTQLVFFQGAESVSITGNQSVSRPFDGNLGGITFIGATERITLESGASLDVSGAGFRGGAATIAASDCNRFTVANGLTYGAGDWRGSSRGEGIGQVPVSQPFGRASAANGGGGGNDHNAGGGGGGNVVRGGVGARNVVMGLFNTRCRGNYPGLGGSALPQDEERIYFGGGGGAGHANNVLGSEGGNGGGIVVLWAPLIEFRNSSSILANGADGSDADGDGGGGGGAAGTVFLLSSSLTGSPDISLEGGGGGNVTNAADRCFGPGGGGAGGRLLSTATNRSGFNPNLSLDGGRFGRRLGSNQCAPNEEPASPGEDGVEDNIAQLVPFGGFVQSADTICGGGIINLTDASSGASSVSWNLLTQDEGLSVSQSGNNLRINTTAQTAGTFLAVQTLMLDGETYPGDTAVFTVLPAPTLTSVAVVYELAVVSINIFGAAGYDLIRYDFGDGTVIDTNATSLTYTYSEEGEYTTSVTLLNTRCGDETFLDTTFIVAELASVNADLKFAEGCSPLTFTITDRSTGTYDDRRWDFPGGNPEVSNEARPTVTYTEPGEYDITLTLLNAVGPDTIRIIPVSVFAQPVADVTVAVDTASATFTNNSTDGTEFFWDFGDDSTSIAAEPTHTYAATGTYTVTYFVENGPCRDSTTIEVVIDVLSDVTDLAELGVSLFPNPTSGRLNLTGPAEITGAFDLSGRMVVTGNSRELDLSTLPAGTYLVAIKAETKTYWVRVVRR